MGIPANYDRERLRSVLSDQYNVISRRQLLECGMTRSAIQHRVGPDGRWRIILPGIYIANGDVTATRREMAALLYAGRDGVITGPFAVRRYGLTASGPDSIEVLVPRRVRRQSVRFVRLIHTARIPENVYRTGPIRIADPVRAVADAVRGYREIRDARTVICAAI